MKSVLLIATVALSGCVTINVYPGAPVAASPPAPAPMGVGQRANEPAVGFVMPPPVQPQRPIDTTWPQMPARPAGAATYPPRSDVDVWAPPNDAPVCGRPCSPPPRAIQGEL